MESSNQGRSNLLYCNLIPHKSQKSRLVTGFQINFLCMDLDQVNHLKDSRAVFKKFGNFTCPTVAAVFSEFYIFIFHTHIYFNFHQLHWFIHIGLILRLVVFKALFYLLGKKLSAPNGHPGLVRRRTFEDDEDSVNWI